MSAFKRVGLVARINNEQIIESLRRAGDLLSGEGAEVVLETATADMLGSADGIPLGDLGRDCDLIVAVGGDGNILSAARAVADYGVPVLGINRGRLGFLADVSPDEIESQLKDVMAGNYTKEEHFLLEGQVSGQKEVPSALNEVLVHSAQMPTMLEMELYVDDVFVYNQHADGLIVSSPTGSTAYALSAGGPIMHPSLDAIALVPMFPHSLTQRPLVVPGNQEVRVAISKDSGVSAKVSFDSHQEFQMAAGEAIVIRKKKETLKLVHPPGHSFYGICRSKLDWASRAVSGDR
ncbi:MAG: NAD(+) kinase [Pseudomonadales bacterium]